MKLYLGRQNHKDDEVNLSDAVIKKFAFENYTMYCNPSAAYSPYIEDWYNERYKEPLKERLNRLIKDTTLILEGSSYCLCY